VRDQIITLPQRGASIRLASEAESAAIPAPYVNPPRLLGNKGELGEFVLPLRNPNSKSSDPADDFTAEAAAWTMTAHEARPGHELQFAAMVERGVSIARAAFAFNSTNAEGWALYAEAIMTPHFPLDGQLFALQLRLQRAARAFLDPMVNLGTMTPKWSCPSRWRNRRRTVTPSFGRGRPSPICTATPACANCGSRPRSRSVRASTSASFTTWSSRRGCCHPACSNVLCWKN